MPRGKKKLKNLVEDADTVEEKDRDEVIHDDDRTVDEIVQEIPGGVRTIKLFRHPDGPRGGRPTYLCEIAPDSFSVEYVKKCYGGGSYFFRWRNENGKRVRTDFDIEGPRKKFKDEEDPDLSEAGSEDGASELLSLLLKKRKEEDEEEERSNHHRNNPDGNGGISAIELMKLLQQAQEQGEARIMKMMEFIRPQPQSPDMTKQVFDIVEKVMSISPAGGDGNPWITTLAMFKDPLSKIVDTIQAAVNKQGAVPSNPPPQSAQQVQHVPQETDVVTMMLKQYLPLFVSAAARNADPQTYADMVLDQVPENQYPSLSAWINRPDCLEGLCTIEPGIRYQQDWWIALRLAIIEGLNDAANVQSQPTSEESQQD